MANLSDENGDDVACCTDDGGFELAGDLKHPECLPIAIAKTDRFFGRLNKGCMEFVRSVPAKNSECSLGAREQVTFTHDSNHEAGQICSFPIRSTKLPRSSTEVMFTDLSGRRLTPYASVGEGDFAFLNRGISSFCRWTRQNARTTWRKSIVLMQVNF